MTKKRNASIPRQPAREASKLQQLPKGTLAKLVFGASFAEYDPALQDSTVYVRTPAFNAALDPNSGKYFFVGRRGTGKTTLRTYCDAQVGQAKVIVPEIFSPSSTIFDLERLENTKRGPFRTLVSVFKRTLLDELLIMWGFSHPAYADLPQVIIDEVDESRVNDFDERTLRYIKMVADAVESGDDEAIVAINKTTKALVSEMKLFQRGNAKYTLLVDSIDDFWDGSELALTYLTAFMHACLELSTQIPWARALLFLRENIFDRVRARDPESSRVETSVSGLDWNQRQLLEMVERRLNRTLTAKFALGGPTWNVFFEQPDAARQQIFEYCHNRPRDVLIYVSHAIDSANENGRERISLEDLEGARRRFSDNRFKDLGDEYAENYAQIALVLRRFYGLGRRYTPGGIEAFLRKLFKDEEVLRLCTPWIYEQQSMEQFVRLLYNIGFIGLRRPSQSVKFRALGPQDTSPPAVSDDTEIEIHKCYWDALDLQDILVRDLPEDRDFGRIGVLLDLPGGLNPTTYVEELDGLLERLDIIPTGTEGAADFEDAVGDILKLCFFRSLENVEPRVRNVEGTVIRDWIASNRAQTGFWSVIRQRYGATQVVWECKNYEELSASDFHQVAYYMGNAIGKFVVIAFRGEVTNGNFLQIKRIVGNDGMVLPLGIRDLKTFIRQNRKGKIKEDHIQDRYDQVIRRVS